jgi:hypothetical protein
MARSCIRENERAATAQQAEGNGAQVALNDQWDAALPSCSDREADCWPLHR